MSDACPSRLSRTARPHCQPAVRSAIAACSSSPRSCRRQRLPTSTAVLAGRVLDAANGSPIGFASVVVEDAASSKQLSGALTGENGRFVVQGLPPGTYKVRISFVGYYPADADLLVSTLNQSYDLGDIRLPRLEGFEEKVTVTAEAIRAAGIDTQVFRLDEGPVAVDRDDPRRAEEPPGRDGRSGGKGLAARQRQGRHPDRWAAVEPDRIRQLSAGWTACRRPTSRRLKSSTTPLRASTPQAWPASSTSFTRRNSSLAGPAMSASGWASASSPSSGATFRPISAASRTTRK